MADLLRSESRLVRLKALYMVGTLNMSSLAQNVCETLLHDACPVVRHEAAYQLGVLKPAGALSALCQALVEDPEELVRHEAAEALGELGDRDAFPWLERACRDTSESVRATAAIAREEIEVIAAARDAIGFAADREYEGSVVQAA
ncbi:MAG TPA: HEAT repeat domain-containing protein [Longimicrobium sp.]|nr:HEAT repeat domain-containing protein [Longimicrobium sp.]